MLSFHKAHRQSIHIFYLQAVHNNLQAYTRPASFVHTAQPLHKPYQADLLSLLVHHLRIRQVYPDSQALTHVPMPEAYRILATS